VSADRPVVRIAGRPTPEETAAVLAVLTTLGNAQEPPAGSRRSLWNARARAARPRLSPGPGAWKGSVLPR
jgi:hypothetical protein